MQKAGIVYMLTTIDNSAIYIGVTSDLPKRVWQHKNKYYPDSFTARYNITKLVYYSVFDCIETAIAEEKRLKAGNRKQKEKLIMAFNPGWQDLSGQLEN